MVTVSPVLGVVMDILWKFVFAARVGVRRLEPHSRFERIVHDCVKGG